MCFCFYFFSSSMSFRFPTSRNEINQSEGGLNEHRRWTTKNLIPLVSKHPSHTNTSINRHIGTYTCTPSAFQSSRTIKKRRGVFFFMHTMTSRLTGLCLGLKGPHQEAGFFSILTIALFIYWCIHFLFPCLGPGSNKCS